MKRSAFAQLFEEYQYPLYRYLYRISGSKQVAEELLQETFYRAMLSLSMQDTRAIRAWLYKVSRHLYIDWLRKRAGEQKMLQSIKEQSSIVDETFHPERVLWQKEQKDRITRIMHQLPERMRTILYLREIEGFSYQELAETMELSPDQVKVTLHRAKIKFREIDANMEGGNSDDR